MSKKVSLLQGLILSAFFSIAPAAEWRGITDGNFQFSENWEPEAHNDNWEAPLAGDRNRTGLLVHNGINFPLNYTESEGETEFSGQLLVGRNRGTTGAMVVSGGALTMNTERRGGAIVGQTVEGSLKMTGGALNLHPGGPESMPGGLSFGCGLIIGNEGNAIGVVEVSGGKLNVGGGLWLGRLSATGSLIISGSGHVVCEGPVLFDSGLIVQKIEFGKDGGHFEVSTNGDLHFSSEGGTVSSYINFPKGSKGQLSLAGKDRSYFEELVQDGRIRIDGLPAKVGQFVFRQEGNKGFYSLQQ